MAPLSALEPKPRRCHLLFLSRLSSSLTLSFPYQSTNPTAWEGFVHCVFLRRTWRILEAFYSRLNSKSPAQGRGQTCTQGTSAACHIHTSSPADAHVHLQNKHVPTPRTTQWQQVASQAPSQCYWPQTCKQSNTEIVSSTPAITSGWGLA
jgi:hypothetical protein